MTIKGVAVSVSLWLMVIGLSYYQQSSDDKLYGRQIAYKQAEMFFQHIVLMRQWNARHGGVYVPVTNENPPNPYLMVPDRDITLSDGRQLTLLNPAYMTRQLSEIERDKTGILFHITSLEPIRPANKADDWERQALTAFKEGQAFYKELSRIGDKIYYRYMAPLVLEEECMKCHAGYDHKVGDKYGGISVSILADSVDSFINQRLERQKRSHIVMGGLGIVILLFGYWLQCRLNRRLAKAENRLQLAYLDALTLLPNRRYYDAFLQKEWKHASRQHYPLSMIMIDIDYFKAYNDSLGHPAGDHCLREVARTLRRYCRRSGDLIARYGGEEFCVVSVCNAEQIKQLAEILGTAIEMMQMPHPNSKISKYVTISLGVASLTPQDKGYDELIHQADQALYAAKQGGRNRVEIYTKEMETLLESNPPA